MKVILDTSVWIEYLKGNKPIHDEVHALLLEDEVIGVSAVFGELMYGVRNKKEETQINTLWELLPKLDETAIMLNSGKYAYTNNFLNKGIGLVDASLAFLAKQNNNRVWTLDKKLKEELGFELF
jgi:predicted nucleic acid-binding protein